MKKIIKVLVMSMMCMAILLTVTGCQNKGTQSSDNETEMSNASKENAANEQEGATRTISTVKGDVEVPAAPKRVLVDYIVGDVVALGVKPIALSTLNVSGNEATFEEEIEGLAFKDEIEGIQYIGWGYDPETVMALEPDLIILSWSDEEYEDLSKIAPTVYIPYGEMTTEERVMMVGETLNKKEEAKQVLNEFNTKVEQSVQLLKSAGVYDKFVTVAQYSDGQAWVAGNKHAVGMLLYDAMGFPVSDKIQTYIIDADKYWGDISLEVLPEYVGDYFIHLGEYPEDWGSNEIINSIPAIKSGRTFSLAGELTWYTDIYSSSRLVDKITAELTSLK